MSAVPHVIKRPPSKARIVRRDIAASTAELAIGPIEKGCEIFGVNKGQFSLIDVLQHCLNATGPADVIVSTWTAAGSDIDHAMGFLADGRVKSLRFVVDFSFPTRQPAYCAALRERFGEGSIRITKVHAKFVTIRNADWNIVIRSSMNLNENRRLETLEISDHAGMAEFLSNLLSELFDGHADGAQFAQTPYARTVDFEKWHPTSGLTEADIHARAKAEHGKFFGDGINERDLRRAGLSTRAGKLK